MALGTADLWVTWTARPRQWRTETDDARAFFDSVHFRQRQADSAVQVADDH